MNGWIDRNPKGLFPGILLLERASLAGGPYPRMDLGKRTQKGADFAFSSMIFDTYNCVATGFSLGKDAKLNLLRELYTSTMCYDGYRS